MPAKISRRHFFYNILTTACSAAVGGIGVGLYSKQTTALAVNAIRPPGALTEEEFTKTCIRCGVCVQDCPYEILKLGKIGDNVPTGTPYFIARTGPCEMCEDIPCIKNCPTAALDKSLTDIEKSKMGTAVLIDQETCIAFLGLRCEICFNVCPIQGKAITIEYEHNKRSGKHARFLPVVHSQSCTGCGLCEKACILEEAAIKVLPIHVAKGKRNSHYRLGWEEKKKAGKSLVTPDVEHKYNLPEGVKYDLQGEGLILDPTNNKNTPFKSNPIDTLNKGLE